MKKELELRIQPHVIDHLGIKMYQKVADVVSEFIANAWDADAKQVNISVSGDSVCIDDDGVGMTFDECQTKFLMVGRNRRKTEKTDHSKKFSRPVLGRKGIGKFAGFGIAKLVEVSTTAESNGEKTSFQLDVTRILAVEDGNAKIDVVEYKDPNSRRKASHGTQIKLVGLNIAKQDMSVLAKELSRRFLLVTQSDEFKILLNGKEIPNSFSGEMEFVFPRDLTDDELHERTMEVDEEGWAVEVYPSGEKIKWRVGFTQKPIDDEELRGVAIFARGKMAQKPFFFDFTGGMSAQQGLEYLTGQMVMDYIDDATHDLIATERQRINLQSANGSCIRAWGIELLKFLCSAWAVRRSQKKMAIIQAKTEPFAERLEKFLPSERKTVEKVLQKIAGFQKLGEARFREWAGDIITSYEKGRLRGVIDQLAESDSLDESKFINVLAESDVLASLNIAESVKTKILAIGELKQRVLAGELENKVRDFIYENPWIVHPKWENFRRERSVENMIKDLGGKVFDGYEPYNGRVDLALSAGDDLLLIEFMRPGLKLDYDHVDRLNLYVLEIRSGFATRSGAKIKKLSSAYVVADVKNDSPVMERRIKQLESEQIYVKTWEDLISSAISQWKDTLDLLKSRHPNDSRIACL